MIIRARIVLYEQCN